MFSSLLRAPRRCQGLVFKRTLANVLSENTALQVYDPNAAAAAKPTDEPTTTPTTQKIETSKTHGLYAFFRRRQGEDLVGEDQYDVLGGLYEEDVVNRSGRAWKASELRLKSFTDLHTLWYVLLREQNLLATQAEEVRRAGIAPRMIQLGMGPKKRECRLSMARIKAVMNERRLAYLGAVKLAEEEKEAELDRAVLKHQITQFNRGRQALRTLQEKRVAAERRKERLARQKDENIKPKIESA
ncbi:mitochondrial 39-S ribosomal protein L47 (MRP-L47)-domain-containing protein [Armillaria novae-zelandiae]|uniref:Large ribosomal subunit protein uL29m n=1 Tax=Armillaria novae-zelandiae TaxID=153914 RepID=A0AA39PQS8_9AGAR|nr:mitochondrial 39-S ribosomal protein L47 (MRP-L47)-domain-containing protein [Armillaria novae-zelandiae]